MSTPRTATVSVIPPEGDCAYFIVKAKAFGGGEAGLAFEQSYETLEEANERADELRNVYRRSGFTTDGQAPFPMPKVAPTRAPRVAPVVMPIPAPVEPDPAPAPVHHTEASVWGAVA